MRARSSAREHGEPRQHLVDGETGQVDEAKAVAEYLNRLTSELVEALVLDRGAADQGHVTRVRQECRAARRVPSMSYVTVTTVISGGAARPPRVRSSTAQTMIGVPGQRSSRARSRKSERLVPATTIASKGRPAYLNR
jgi:hypothetical protein